MIDLIDCFLEYWSVGVFFLEWLSIKTVGVFFGIAFNKT